MSTGWGRVDEKMFRFLLHPFTMGKKKRKMKTDRKGRDMQTGRETR